MTVTLLSRIHDERIIQLRAESPDDMDAVQTVCQSVFTRMTSGKEKPENRIERLRLFNALVSECFGDCVERRLLWSVCNRLGFGWEAILYFVISTIIRYLINEWL